MFKYEKELLDLTPPNFNLKNYASTSKLNTEEWELNLSYRTEILLQQKYMTTEQVKKKNLENIFWGTNERSKETDDTFKSCSDDDIFDQKNITDAVLYEDLKLNSRDNFVRINLYASDAQLEKEFKQWLQEKRKQNSIIFKQKEFTAAQYKKMHLCNLLPYLDLIKWHELNETRITDGQAGVLIFPDDTRGSMNERIRNTTRVWAKKVFETSSTNILLNMKK